MGIGAYGNPSSFHDPVVRNWRHAIRTEISEPLFAAVERLSNGGKHPRNLEFMFDRLCQRRKDWGKPDAESWHRDVLDPGKYKLKLSVLESDDIFGGWINLDRDDRPDGYIQKFACLLKTHNTADARAAQQKGGGFAAFSKEDVQKYKFDELLEQQGPVPIPPGHVMIFYQRLTHAVFSKNPPVTPSVRLFVGHRLTHAPVGTSFFHVETELAITNFGCPRIPSAQLPASYAKMTLRPLDDLDPWSLKTFKKECLFQKVMGQNSKFPGAIYHVPGSPATPGSPLGLNPFLNHIDNRCMDSLASYGFGDHFPPYNERDRLVMTVQPLPGKSKSSSSSARAPPPQRMIPIESDSSHKAEITKPPPKASMKEIIDLISESSSSSTVSRASIKRKKRKLI